MDCKHLVLSKDNYVPIANLSSNVEPVTSLDNLRTVYRGRQTKWTDLSTTYISITGVFAEERQIDFFAICGHNLPNNARVLFQLYNSTTVQDATTAVGGSDWMEIGEILPQGLFRWGIDPWASKDNDPLNDVISYFFGALIGALSFKISIEHNYGYVPPTEPPPVYVSDGIYRQDDVTRVVCIEAENGVVTPNDSDTWESVGDVGASDDIRLYKNGSQFYWSANEGPKIEFKFNATVSGSYKIYLRMYSTDGNSIYSTFDGINSSHFWVNGELVNQGWVWLELRSINLIAGQLHNLTLSARDHYISIDKMVIQTVASAAPTNNGPAESSFGTTIQSGYAGAVTSGDNVSLRMAMVGNTITLEENFSYPSSITFLDSPNLQKTLSGHSIAAREQNKIRSASLNLDHMSNNDRLVMSQFEKENASRPFLISPYPNEVSWFRGDYIFLAILEDALEYTHFRQNIHQTELRLLEV